MRTRLTLIASITLLVIAGITFAASTPQIADAAFTHLTNLAVRYNLVIGTDATPNIDLDTTTAEFDVDVDISGGQLKLSSTAATVTGAQTYTTTAAYHPLTAGAIATLTLVCDTGQTETTIYNVSANNINIATTNTHLGAALDLGQYDSVTFYCQAATNLIPIAAKDN